MTPRVRLHVALVAALASAGCTRSTSTTAPVVVVATATPTTGASPPSGEVTQPRSFACGEDHCAVGRETCCSDGTHATCLPTLPEADPNAPQWLASQIAECERSAALEYGLSELSRCDDSLDCDPSQVCCNAQLFGGAMATTCRDVHRIEAPECAYGEACAVDTPCRTAGSTCIEGRCRRPLGTTRCGEAPCAAGEECCGAPAQCQPPSACEGLPLFECARPADCPKGEVCQLSLFGSQCFGEYDAANRSIVCETDVDCPPFVCALSGGTAPRCSPAEPGWLRTCGC